MKKFKMLWLFTMAVLSLTLMGIVRARVGDDSTVEVILGGTEGVFVTADSVSFIDPGYVEPVVEDDGLLWPDIDIEQPL